MVALSFAGSATLLFSCAGKPAETLYDPETLMTESSEHRTVIMSENGRVSYEFSTPLVEGYSMAANPYQEFRRGVNIKTFTSDTLPLVDATLRANYAIYYENQKLWEAKGNVVIYKYNRNDTDTAVVSRTEVYTQQLFWNAKTKQIYSNVDTKVLQPDGWHFGVGFDADEALKNIHFRKYSSEMEFDVTDDMQDDEAAADGKAPAAGKPATQRDNSNSNNVKRPDPSKAAREERSIDAPRPISSDSRRAERQASLQEIQHIGEESQALQNSDNRTLQTQSINASAAVQRQNAAQ